MRNLLINIDYLSKKDRKISNQTKFEIKIKTDFLYNLNFVLKFVY